MPEKNYFTVLNEINVNDHAEEKNGLTYLSWAWAWAEVKKVHANAIYTIYENKDGWFYHTDGKTAWVKTGVTIEGIEHIEYLPVMDFRNKSIPAEAITSFDVNKAIQRSLTKALARHGLGLYIYAGEDLPEAKDDVSANKIQVDDNAPIRPQTLELLNADISALPVDRLLKFNEFYSKKYGNKEKKDLTQKEATYLRTLLAKDSK